MSKRVYDTLGPLRGALDKVSIVYRGSAVSVEDATLLRQALAIRGALLCDLSSGRYQAALNAYYRAVVSYTARSIDAFDLGNDVKAIGLALRLYLEKFENGDRDDRTSFLKKLSCRYTGIILAPMYPELDEFLAHPDAEVMRRLLYFVDFISKLNFTSISLEDLMVEEYDQQELSMTEWHYDPFIINELNAIVTEWFRGFVPNIRGKCHHGGGASAELGRSLRGRVSKDASLRMSDRLFRLYQRWNGDPAEVPVFSRVAREDDRTSVLQFVPKSMVTNRVISKEPVTLMWLQQGFKEQLYSYFRRQRFLRKVINLQDQSLSSAMARQGSFDGSYATLDLSAASDSVSLELVSRLFADTKLLVPLVETRSTSTCYKAKDGSVVASWKLRKFAPMGSALCFPVECVVFAAICEAARRRVGSRKLFRVYGDDLVVPTEYADVVCDYLAACHFKVNERKSFVHSSEYMFREACGGEFFNGKEVTPVRLSRALKPMTTKPSGAEFSSWVGLINRLTEAGLRSAQSYVLRSARLHWSERSVFDCLEFSNQPGRGVLTYYPFEERRRPSLKGLERGSDDISRSQQRWSFWTTHVASACRKIDCKNVDSFVKSIGIDPEEVKYRAWLYDSEYRCRSFLPADHILRLPEYVRPEAVRDAEYYPGRDELLVTPLA